MARSTSASSAASARSLSGAARLLAAALAAASAAALYESGDGVLQIASEKDWNDKVIKAPGLFLVECASARARARTCTADAQRARPATRATCTAALVRARARMHPLAGPLILSLARSLAPPIIAQSTRPGAATARTWRPSGRR
jgi:hypothetical protein